MMGAFEAIWTLGCCVLSLALLGLSGATIAASMLSSRLTRIEEQNETEDA